MLQKALREVTDSLSLQGYILKAEQSPEGNITVIIEAGPNACKKCLTSRTILEKIIAGELRENGVNYNKLSIKMP